MILETIAEALIDSSAVDSFIADYEDSKAIIINQNIPSNFPTPHIIINFLYTQRTSNMPRCLSNCADNTIFLRIVVSKEHDLSDLYAFGYDVIDIINRVKTDNGWLEVTGHFRQELADGYPALFIQALEKHYR
jgi:hypothetical protein